MPESKAEIILTKDAQRDLDSLDRKTLNRTIKAFGMLSRNPKHGKALAKPLKPAYSYRFGTPQGEFRAAYIKHQRKLLVLAVGLRKEIYKTLKKRI